MRYRWDLAYTRTHVCKSDNTCVCDHFVQLHVYWFPMDSNSEYKNNFYCVKCIFIVHAGST